MQDKGAIMRGTGMVQKLEKARTGVVMSAAGSSRRPLMFGQLRLQAFVKQVGSDYINSLVGDLVRQIVLDPELNLEVDPKKLKLHGGCSTGDNEEEVRLRRRRARSVAQSLAHLLTFHSRTASSSPITALCLKESDRC